MNGWGPWALLTFDSSRRMAGRGLMRSLKAFPCTLMSTPHRVHTFHTSTLPYLQVLDKNTCRLVAGEYDMLVVDKAEAGITDGE